MCKTDRPAQAGRSVCSAEVPHFVPRFGDGVFQHLVRYILAQGDGGGLGRQIHRVGIRLQLPAIQLQAVEGRGQGIEFGARLPKKRRRSPERNIPA